MTSQQARFLFEFLLPQLKSEQTVTQRILSSVPSDQGAYRPHPKSKSAFELSRHIAAVELWFLDAVIHQRFGELTPPPVLASTCQDVASWYTENFTSRVPLLKELSDENLATQVDFIGLRNDPAVAYLNIAIRHSVHHRGQLSSYLRPMGAKVPAIYVESADEPYPANDGGTPASEQRPPAF